MNIVHHDNLLTDITISRGDWSGDWRWLPAVCLRSISSVADKKNVSYLFNKKTNI